VNADINVIFKTFVRSLSITSSAYPEDASEHCYQHSQRKVGCIPATSSLQSIICQAQVH